MDEFGVFANQPFEGCEALGFEEAKGKGAVDLIDADLQAENGVKVDRDVDQDVDIVGETLPGEMLKVADADGAFSPGFGLDLCDKRIGVRIFFDQVEAVIVLIRAKGMVSDVSDDPEGELVEFVVDGLRDGGGQL